MRDLLARLVSRLLNRLEHDFNGFHIRLHRRREAALVADRRVVSALFQHALEGMEDLDAPAQRLGKRRRSHRHHHELLEVDIAIGVRAAVQDIHHRHRNRVRAGAAEIAVERQLKRPGRCASRRHRNCEDGIGSQPSLVGRAIERDHFGVERALVGGIHADERAGNLGVHVLDGFEHSLPLVALLVAVAQFNGLMLAGGRATGHNGPRAGAAIEKNFSFYSWIATRVEHLASADFSDRGKRHKCVLFLVDEFRNVVAIVETWLATSLPYEVELYRTWKGRVRALGHCRNDSPRPPRTASVIVPDFHLA